MKIPFLIACLFAGLLILEAGFLAILFPGFPAPLLIMSAVVAWVLILGFQRALFFTVPLTVLYDVLLTGSIQPFSAYMVAIAYVASFLSRRLVVEHQGSATLLYAALIAGSAAGYQALEALLDDRHPLAYLSQFSFLPFIVFSFIAFWCAYGLLRAFTASIERMRNEQALFTR